MSRVNELKRLYVGIDSGRMPENEQRRILRDYIAAHEPSDFESFNARLADSGSFRARPAHSSAAAAAAALSPLDIEYKRRVDAAGGAGKRKEHVGDDEPAKRPLAPATFHSFDREYAAAAAGAGAAPVVVLAPYTYNRMRYAPTDGRDDEFVVVLDGMAPAERFAAWLRLQKPGRYRQVDQLETVRTTVDAYGPLRDRFPNGHFCQSLRNGGMWPLTAGPPRSEAERQEDDDEGVPFVRRMRFWHTSAPSVHFTVGLRTDRSEVADFERLLEAQTPGRYATDFKYLLDGAAYNPTNFEDGFVTADTGGLFTVDALPRLAREIAEDTGDARRFPRMMQEIQDTATNHVFHLYLSERSTQREVVAWLATQPAGRYIAVDRIARVIVKTALLMSAITRTYGDYGFFDDGGYFSRITAPPVAAAAAAAVAPAAARIPTRYAKCWHTAYPRTVFFIHAPVGVPFDAEGLLRQQKAGRYEMQHGYGTLPSLFADNRCYITDAYGCNVFTPQQWPRTSAEYEEDERGMAAAGLATLRRACATIKDDQGEHTLVLSERSGQEQLDACLARFRGRFQLIGELKIVIVSIALSTAIRRTHGDDAFVYTLATGRTTEVGVLADAAAAPVAAAAAAPAASQRDIVWALLRGAAKPTYGEIARMPGVTMSATDILLYDMSRRFADNPPGSGQTARLVREMHGDGYSANAIADMATSWPANVVREYAASLPPRTTPGSPLYAPDDDDEPLYRRDSKVVDSPEYEAARIAAGYAPGSPSYSPVSPNAPDDTGYSPVSPSYSPPSPHQDEPRDDDHKSRMETLVRALAHSGKSAHEIARHAVVEWSLAEVQEFLAREGLAPMVALKWRALPSSVEKRDARELLRKAKALGTTAEERADAYEQIAMSVAGEFTSEDVMVEHMLTEHDDAEKSAKHIREYLAKRRKKAMDNNTLAVLSTVTGWSRRDIDTYARLYAKRVEREKRLESNARRREREAEKRRARAAAASAGPASAAASSSSAREQADADDSDNATHAYDMVDA